MILQFLLDIYVEFFSEIYMAVSVSWCRGSSTNEFCSKKIAGWMTIRNVKFVG